MTRFQWVLLLLVCLWAVWSWQSSVTQQRTYDALRRDEGRASVPRPDAACWKATQPWTAPEHLTTGMWIEDGERGVHGICYATRAACEAAWEATDPEHVTWEGFCWDAAQNPQDVGW